MDQLNAGRSSRSTAQHRENRLNQPVIRYPFASNELLRLREVRKVLGSERPRCQALSEIAERARILLGSAASLASVVEVDHQWFLARVGVDVESTPRSHSICSRAILSDQPLVLPDTLADKEFAKHPAVVSAPHVRFYVGAPIILSSGFRVGSLCGIDVTPRKAPSAAAVEDLVGLASDIARHLEARHLKMMNGKSRQRARVPSDPKTEFLSLVGHELRSPLTVLLGNALLLQGRVSTEPERRMIEAIAASGKHLHQLIEKILHFSSLEKGELILEEEYLPVSEMVRSAIAPLKPMLHAAGRKIRVSCALDESTVFGDRDQFIFALSSLVANAATHGEGDLEVTAKRSADGMLRLTVHDQGPGLPERLLEQSDRPFVVGEDIDRRTANGLGLGLPLATKLTGLYGGRIASAVENGRTKVELCLPAWRLT